MAERTYVRGSTQVRDESVGLNKLTPAVQELLLRAWARKDFAIDTDGQQVINDVEFVPEKFMEVYVNGVLQTQTLDYVIGEENIFFNVPLTIDDNISVFYGYKPIYEQIYGEDIRRHETVALIGGGIKPFTSDSRWYPPYKSIIVGAYAALGVVSNQDIIFSAKKNGVEFGQFSILADQHRSSNQFIHETFIPPDDYMTIDILSGSGGEGLNITVTYLIEP